MDGNTQKIRYILKKLQISEPPIDVEKIASFFSIQVVPYKDFPENISGMIVRDSCEEVEKVYIGFNTNQSKVRQRFTLAHELGHYLNGHDDLRIIEDGFDKDTVKEKEANAFAGELLIPKDFLEADMKSGQYDIPSLAKRYLVSEQVISIRLLHSGLLVKY